MAVEGLQVRVHDTNLRTVAILDTLTTLDVSGVHNDVGIAHLQIAADDANAGKLIAGNGLSVWLDGATDAEFAGPIRVIRTELVAGASAEVLTVMAPSYDVLLQERLIYGDPANAATAQAVAADVRTGNAETVIRGFVDANLGPTALAARRAAALTLAANGNLGPSSPQTARFLNLLQLIGKQADQAGLGFRVVYTAGVGAASGSLQFRVFTPADKTGLVQFSTALGNLTAYSYEVAAPKTTRAIVGGGGTGTARVIRERANTAAEAAWGMRAETFVDKAESSTNAVLDQAGDEQLFTDGPTAALSVTITPSPQARYPQDFGRSDKVRVIVRGTAIDDIVRQVDLKVDRSGGLKVVPTIGLAPTDAGQALYRKYAALTGQVLGLAGRT